MLKGTKRPTQEETVLKHLQSFGFITSWDAIKKYHITRLGAYIYLLRKKGYNITNHNKSFKNKYGNGYYTVYELKDRG